MNLAMDDSFATRPSLLVRVRNVLDESAWRQFVHMYAPLIHRFLRRCQLQDADAEDVAQEVFRTVAQSIRQFEYDPQRGRFRDWLYKVARSRLADHLACQKRQVKPKGGPDGDSRLEQWALSEEDLADDWENEYMRHVFRWAVERIRNEFRESTWRAFWQTSVDGTPAKIVADRLGMSVGAVYIARSRVIARTKTEIERFEQL